MWTGCEIQDGKDGVHFTYVPDGRASGEAFVDLLSADDIKKALSKNKQHMGKRYIDGKVLGAPTSFSSDSLVSKAVIKLQIRHFMERARNVFQGWS